jgi:pyridoxal 5'-phosphate synthase pdxS subunit
MPGVVGRRHLLVVREQGFHELGRFFRVQGEAGTGNVVEAVRHMRQMNKQIRQIQNMDEDELYAYAKV